MSHVYGVKVMATSCFQVTAVLRLEELFVKQMNRTAFRTFVAINTSMGTTKDIDYEFNEKVLARYGKALGHPARVAIIRLLLQRQSCVCGDIVEEIQLSQSTISQHLKELRSVGIIKGDINGPAICYCIDAEVWDEIRNSFLGLFDSFVPNNDCQPTNQKNDCSPDGSCC